MLPVIKIKVSRSANYAGLKRPVKVITAKQLNLPRRAKFLFKQSRNVERFFGSLKHDWLLKIPQQTREHKRNDVMAYMRYYNLEQLHTANGALSPVEYEQSSLRKVS